MKPVPFVFDFDLKAASHGDVTASPIELANGDLLIEGIGANYDIDREDEAFEEGSFQRGLKTFLEGNAPLCYHHDYKTVIGKIVDAIPMPGQGIWVKAIVDHQPENSPWRHIYDGIKKGRINQFSCGGIFKRRETKSGPRIFDVDLLEWSATPVAIGRGTNFSVVAGKALGAPVEGKADLTAEEEKVVEASVAEKRELEKEDIPQTPAIIEPAPEREDDTSEEDAIEEIREETNDLDPSEAIEATTITGNMIAAATITADKIAAGAIGVTHFDDDVVSRLQELKPEPEGPKIEDLATALAKFDSSLDRIAQRVGVDLSQEKKENVPSSGPVIFSE